MLLLIEIVRFQQIVIDILHGDIDGDMIGSHRVELKHNQRAKDVLRKHLVCT